MSKIRWAHCQWTVYRISDHMNSRSNCCTRWHWSSRWVSSHSRKADRLSSGGCHCTQGLWCHCSGQPWPSEFIRPCLHYMCTSKDRRHWFESRSPGILMHLKLTFINGRLEVTILSVTIDTEAGSAYLKTAVWINHLSPDSGLQAYDHTTCHDPYGFRTKSSRYLLRIWAEELASEAPWTQA